MWDFLQTYGPRLFDGALVTSAQFVLAALVACTAALAAGLGRLSAFWPVRSLATVYIEIFRGTSLLVQLYWIFFVLPLFGVSLPKFEAGFLSVGLNVGAYGAEIVRGAIQAVPKGQWEAAYSIGMNWPQVMWRVILPQAARIAVPPLSNTFISLVKDTSLAAAVTVPELFQAAQRLASVTYEPLILYIETAIIYLLFSSVLSTLQDRLEHRLTHKETRELAL